MHGPNFIQILAFGLAASNAANGLQLSQNTGIARHAVS